jgi:hypothetical protein
VKGREGKGRPEQGPRRTPLASPFHLSLSTQFLGVKRHKNRLEQTQAMEGKRYPQFLLIGDSIVQFSSLLRDGFCFGAGLEERESLLGYLEWTLAGSLSPLSIRFCTEISDD